MSTNYDWAHLSDAVNPQKTKLAYDEVKHLFKKVAFDVYKQNSSDKLWELRTDEDGSQYLVALYEDDSDLVVESQEDKVWTATANADNDNVTLSFKNVPIARFASSEYQFTPDQASKFADFIEKKASNPKFIQDLLKTMPSAKQEAVLEMLREGVK